MAQSPRTRASQSFAGASAARLRRDIDAGRTGDKVSWPDPAAAPLGTDEEAAGTPLHATLVDAAREYETSRPHGDPHGKRSGVGMAWWLGVFALIVAVLLGWAVIGS
jgi:hypothetical protein